jgi:hypothetical protein
VDEIEEEILFRQRVSASRDLLSSRALELAFELQTVDEKRAKEFADLAVKHIKIMEKEGLTVANRIRLANIQIWLGQLDDAITRLMEVCTDVEQNSRDDWNARKLIAVAYRRKADAKGGTADHLAQAAAFPEFLALAMPKGFREPVLLDFWPDMADFLKECYSKGRTMPKQMQQRFDEYEKHLKSIKGRGKSGQTKSEPGPEEKKDEPNKEEPKEDKKADEAIKK